MGDTWEWDGTTWRQLFPATSPSARKGQRMVFDEARGQMVMFGGATDETWLFNGQNWRLAAPSARPPIRYAPQMVYDRGRERVTVIGGFAMTTPDVWEWDGSTWTRAADLGDVPPGEVAYDAAHGYVLALSTSTDARTYVRAAVPAVAAPVGSACGVGGGPGLAAFGLPQLGRARFGLEVARAPAASPAVLVASLGAASLALGGGCTLYVDPAQVQLTLPALVGASGHAAWTLPVPPIAPLQGTQFHVQVAALSPQGAALGLDFTRGMRLVLGD